MSTEKNAIHRLWHTGNTADCLKTQPAFHFFPVTFQPWLRVWTTLFLSQYEYESKLIDTRSVNIPVRENVLHSWPFSLKCLVKFSRFVLLAGDVSHILSYKRRLNCQKQCGIWSVICNIILGNRAVWILAARSLFTVCCKCKKRKTFGNCEDS